MKFSPAHLTVPILACALTAWGFHHARLSYIDHVKRGDEYSPAVEAFSDTYAPTCFMYCAEETIWGTNCSTPQNPYCYCGYGENVDAIYACTAANCSTTDAYEARRFMDDQCTEHAPTRDRGPLTRRLNWAMFAVASLFVFGRLVSRAPKLGGSGYGWDDWVATICYALLIPTDVSSEYEVRNGLGRDMFMIPIAERVTVLKWFYVGEILYNMIVMLTKLSLVLLYLRIWTADSSTKTFRTVCWALVAILNATWIAGVFTIIFQCSPVSYTWTRVTGDTQGTCIDIEAFTYTYAALNIIYDVIVILLPVRALFKLSKPLPQKLGISSVFLVGFLVTICSIVRLQYLVRLGESTNLTWDFQYIGMWSLVEANFSVVCCCMPAMAGLLQRIWLRNSNRNNSKRTLSAQQTLISEDRAESRAPNV